MTNNKIDGTLTFGNRCANSRNINRTSMDHKEGACSFPLWVLCPVLIIFGFGLLYCAISYGKLVGTILFNLM